MRVFITDLLIPFFPFIGARFPSFSVISHHFTHLKTLLFYSICPIFEPLYFSTM